MLRNPGKLFQKPNTFLQRILPRAQRSALWPELLVSPGAARHTDLEGQPVWGRPWGDASSPRTPGSSCFPECGAWERPSIAGSWAHAEQQCPQAGRHPQGMAKNTQSRNLQRAPVRCGQEPENGYSSEDKNFLSTF